MLCSRGPPREEPMLECPVATAGAWGPVQVWHPRRGPAGDAEEDILCF